MNAIDGPPMVLLEARNSGPYMILAAHPDDETIGLASFLPEWADRVLIVHVTDGSPSDLRDARAAGFYSQQAYAEARRREAGAALALASVPAASIIALRFVDQELAYNLPGLVERVITLQDRLKPDIIFTHAYEGGHPDHDSISFATAAATSLTRSATRVFEFCSYHAGEQGIVTGAFLPSSAPVCTRRLNHAEQELKRRMFSAYASQRGVLDNFQVETERIRAAPGYDYTAAPQSGRLYYEGRISKLTGECWRTLCASAATELRI